MGSHPLYSDFNSDFCSNPIHSNLKSQKIPHPFSSDLSSNPISIRTQLSPSSPRHHGYNNATPAQQYSPTKGGTNSTMRAGSRPPANSAHQEDESFEPFSCLAPNDGAASLRCPNNRWPASPTRSRRTITIACWVSCASHLTCGRKHVWVFSGCPASISTVNHSV